MTPTECAALARYTRAHFPQQPIDEYTADALHELLVDYPPVDCRQAVLTIAERGEQWCPPTSIKAEVKRIRSKRIDAHPPVDPPAGLTDAEERIWQVEKNRRIANGEAVAPTRELGTRDMSGIRGQLPAPPTVKREDVGADRKAAVERARVELHERRAVPVAEPLDADSADTEPDPRNRGDVADAGAVAGAGVMA